MQPNQRHVYTYLHTILSNLSFLLISLFVYIVEARGRACTSTMNGSGCNRTKRTAQRGGKHQDRGRQKNNGCAEDWRAGEDAWGGQDGKRRQLSGGKSGNFGRRSDLGGDRGVEIQVLD